MQSLSSGVELRLLGWPADSPRLHLDYEAFAYAGNFETGRTGIAVAAEDDVDTDVVADVDAGVENAVVDGTSLTEDVASSPTPDTVLAAASFDEDRAAENALRIRYVSVRDALRGEGIGPKLLAFVVDRAGVQGFDRVRIGVNNPIAYQACYRAGFGFTGEESGMGELVLEAPPADGRSDERYREGLKRFADRDLPPAQLAVVERHENDDPPGPIDPPSDDAR